jgi:hypothetical protein
VSAIDGVEGVGMAPDGRRDHKPKASPAAETKRPFHLGVAVGLTTGAYAASLLVAARLQIDADRSIIEDRTPVEAAISALGDHHDWMDDRLVEARSQYAIGAASYVELQARLASMDKRLAKLDSVLGTIEELGASIRASLARPNLPSVGWTGSHQGGGNTSGNSGGSGTADPPAAPTPPPPPPTGGSTGASGAP